MFIRLFVKEKASNNLWNDWHWSKCNVFWQGSSEIQRLCWIIRYIKVFQNRIIVRITVAFWLTLSWWRTRVSLLSNDRESMSLSNIRAQRLTIVDSNRWRCYRIYLSQNRIPYWKENTNLFKSICNFNLQICLSILHSSNSIRKIWIYREIVIWIDKKKKRERESNLFSWI